MSSVYHFLECASENLSDCIRDDIQVVKFDEFLRFLLKFLRRDLQGAFHAFPNGFAADDAAAASPVAVDAAFLD